MENLRVTTEFEKEVFMYLNDLRDSGITNMFGARPYVCNRFNVSTYTGGRLLTLWMKNFDSDGSYDEIIDAENSPITNA